MTRYLRRILAILAARRWSPSVEIDRSGRGEWARLEQGITDVQAIIGASLLPVLRRAGFRMEAMLARADGRWNRHQMIGDRGRGEWAP